MDAKTFVVIGVGGVGTTLSNDLAAMLEYKAPNSFLLLVDGDNFEKRNKERQAFASMGNKAESKAKELAGSFETTAIVPLAKWVVDTIDTKEEDKDKVKTQEELAQEEKVGKDGPGSKILASDLLDEDFVVFAVVDNDRARKVIFDAAAQLNNVDVFSGGNDDQLFGSVYHYQRRNGKDVTMHPGAIHDQYVNPKDRNPGDLSCQERAELEGGTQLIAANRGVSAWILGRVQKTIFDNNPPGGQGEIYFDLADGVALGYDRSPVKDYINPSNQETTSAGAAKTTASV